MIDRCFILENMFRLLSNKLELSEERPSFISLLKIPACLMVQQYPLFSLRFRMLIIFIFSDRGTSLKPCLNGPNLRGRDGRAQLGDIVKTAITIKGEQVFKVNNNWT